MKNRVLGLAVAVAHMAGIQAGQLANRILKLPDAPPLNPEEDIKGNRETRRGSKSSSGHSFLGRGSRCVAQDKRNALKKRNRRRNKQ